MQLAEPDTAPVDLATCVYLDLETTGLEPEDEVVAIGILDAQGAPLLDSLVRPQGPTAWPEAQRSHGISPDDVATAPTWAELATRIHTAVADRQVVIYNADFDGRCCPPCVPGSSSGPAGRASSHRRARSHPGCSKTSRSPVLHILGVGATGAAARICPCQTCFPIVQLYNWEMPGS